MAVVVAIPYPGRGHINPMMNLCRLIASKRKHDLTIYIILTEEWLGLIRSDLQDPDGLRFVTIPNVLPSEHVRGSDHAGFLEAVQRDMEGPVQEMVNRTKLDLIISDTFLGWATRFGREKGVAVASFWPLSASLFSVLYHHHLVLNSKYYPVDLSVLPDDDL